MLREKDSSKVSATPRAMKANGRLSLTRSLRILWYGHEPWFILFLESLPSTYFFHAISTHRAISNSDQFSPTPTVSWIPTFPSRFLCTGRISLKIHDTTNPYHSVTTSSKSRSSQPRIQLRTHYPKFLGYRYSNDCPTTSASTFTTSLVPSLITKKSTIGPALGMMSDFGTDSFRHWMGVYFPSIITFAPRYSTSCRAGMPILPSISTFT
jgi:hypothetical protein